MIYIFTGNGKGKTTGAFGTALRALGRGKRVHIIQFMKSKEWFKPAEVTYLEKVEKKKLKIDSFGRKGWVNFRNPSEQDIAAVTSAATKAKEIIIKEKPFLLVLDEINVAVLFKMLPEKEVLDLMELGNKKKVHMILTGRGAGKKMIKLADLVTEMKEVKHLYADGKGSKAVEGLEF